MTQLTKTPTAQDATTKLKCRFCHVKVNRWLKEGKRTIDGFDTMKEHIILFHPEEADKMEMVL